MFTKLERYHGASYAQCSKGPFSFRMFGRGARQERILVYGFFSLWFMVVGNKNQPKKFHVGYGARQEELCVEMYATEVP